MIGIAVDAPSIAPARGGLLAVANVVESEGTIWHGINYESALCGPVRRIPTDGSEKQFDKAPVIEGERFGVYRGVESSMFARGQAPDQARAAFEAGEGYGVEQGVQELVLNPNATILADGAVSPKRALGLLEQHAADTYGGLPTLHVSKFGVPYLPSLEVDSDTWALNTNQGTPVANGGGYGTTGPGGTEAEEGQFWLYISGQVNLFRSEVQAVPADDLRYNKSYALLERIYVPTVECFVAAVLVQGD